MGKKKVRKEIPNDLAAKVLFFSNRICCICRTRSKPIQIHHIDEDPSNNVFENLAVLCFDCHNDTMIIGGFGRKLNAEQVILYRDDWLRKVAETRAQNELNNSESSSYDISYKLRYATSIAEIYKENKQYGLLSTHYHFLGNYELRDKYIELQLANFSTDQLIVRYRLMQGRIDLIPEEVIEREISRHTSNRDWAGRARLLLKLGRVVEAIDDYAMAIQYYLSKGNFLPVSSLLNELNKERVANKLLEFQLKKVTEEDDLWWQVRTLEELGWEKEQQELLIKNKQKIETEENIALKIRLAHAEGDKEKAFELQKQLARGVKQGVIGRNGEFIEIKNE